MHIRHHQYASSLGGMIVKEIIRPLSSSLHYIHRQQQNSSTRTKPLSANTSQTSNLSTKAPAVKEQTKHQKSANDMQQKQAKPQKKPLQKKSNPKEPIPSDDLTAHPIAMIDPVAMADPITNYDEKTPMDYNKSFSQNKSFKVENSVLLSPQNKESFGSKLMKVCTITLCYTLC